MPRLFVAAWPPDDVVEELTALRRKDQRGVRFVPPENWHVTLRFLGNCDPADVVDAIDGAELAPAVARLGPAVDVIDERLLAVPVTGVDDLAARIGRATASIGEPARKRFVGHLTVARIKRGAPMPSTLGALVHAEFDVHEIDVVQSRLEPSGARYESLHTWRLG
jgi:RNA 2',3'-cyclic 3'-phosphodiesterase